MRPIGGFFIRIAVSIETGEGNRAILAGVSLGLHIPFPGKSETELARDRFEYVSTPARSDQARDIGATTRQGVRKDV